MQGHVSFLLRARTRFFSSACKDTSLLLRARTRFRRFAEVSIGGFRTVGIAAVVTLWGDANRVPHVVLGLLG